MKYCLHLGTVRDPPSTSLSQLRTFNRFTIIIQIFIQQMHLMCRKSTKPVRLFLAYRCYVNVCIGTLILAFVLTEAAMFCNYDALGGEWENN